MNESKDDKICSCGEKNPSTLEQCQQCHLDLSSEESNEKTPVKKKKMKGNTEKKVEHDSGKKQETKGNKVKTSTAPKMKFCTCGKRNKKTARYCVLCNRDISYEVAMTDLEHQCLETGSSYDPSMEVKIPKKKKISLKKGLVSEVQALPNRVETYAWLSDDSEIDFTKSTDFYCRFHSIDGNFSILLEDFPFSIGRGQGPFGNYLLSKNFVSRNHATVSVESDGIYLKHIGNMNPTCINQAVIYEKTKLNSGDELGIGGNRIGLGVGPQDDMDENVAYISVEIGRK